jgi:outer membrane protein assembly factor BamB
MVPLAFRRTSWYNSDGMKRAIILIGLLVFLVQGSGCTQDTDSWIVRIGDMYVDVETGKEVKQEEQKAVENDGLPRFTTRGSKCVIRTSGSGDVLWSTNLDERIWIHQSPDLATCGKKVYVGTESGITALDTNTGKALWKSSGPQDHLCATEKQVFAIGLLKDTPDESRWLVARDAETGDLNFKVRLPDRAAAQEVTMAGTYVVVRDTWEENAFSYVVDQKGILFLKRDGEILSVLAEGKDLLLVSAEGWAELVSDTGKTIWKKSVSGGHLTLGYAPKLIRLSGGDILIVSFNPIADSGVEVTRLNVKEGKISWTAYCKPLFVGHSTYSHAVRVEIRDEKIAVISIASGGKFFEILSLSSGETLNRKVFK